MKPFQPESLPLRAVAWEPLIPLIGQANRALAHYGGALLGVPNPDVLLSPLSDVLEFDAGESPNEQARLFDIQEIVNYRRALRRAEVTLKSRPFNLNLLLELHGLLLNSVRGRDKGRGRLRTTQNWIGRPGCPMQEADFVPPDPLMVPDALAAWEKYYHAEEPDALVQLAVVHAQFEIIHPFNDGNGRMGRIIIPLFLAERGILSRPTFYLSGYLEDHREEYIERLRPLGRKRGAWNRWIEFFLRGLIEQAGENARKARAIMDLYESMKRQVIELTHSQYAVPLLDAIFEQPIFASNALARRPGMPSKATVANLLGQLKDAGSLTVRRGGSGRRPQVLGFPALMNLCEGKPVF